MKIKNKQNPNTGKLPIQFIIAKKRFMYLWEILSRNPSEIIYKVYKLQEMKPTIGDWFLMMKEERKKYAINITDEEIKSLSKHKFKTLVQKKIHRYAFDYLLSLGKSHSKSRKTIESLNSDQLETQQYLVTNQLTTPQRQLMYYIQSNSYDVKANYKKKYVHDMTCRSCKINDSYEDITHLTICRTLNDDKLSYANPEDIYSNLDKQIQFIKYFEKIDLKRKLLEEV